MPLTLALPRFLPPPHRPATAPPRILAPTSRRTADGKFAVAGSQLTGSSWGGEVGIYGSAKDAGRRKKAAAYVQTPAGNAALEVCIGLSLVVCAVCIAANLAHRGVCLTILARPPLKENC